ncbi:glycoside hydrolase family 43 protein [Croceibacterium sp. TMG7-5b_MA50]|uniref:glycoside hydrolase family 43 protein n=1 Tax=Croceibacterium sp. TMG7-5b_MA50 TaxID=3121290 RepID=UPI003221FFCD
MQRIIHRLVPALALALATTACAPAVPPQGAAAAPSAEYPLLLPQMQLHDPFIVPDEATGTYHLFTRNEAAMTGDTRLGTMAYTSRDLKHWSRPRVVFTLPDGNWADGGAWAPEVHRWRGKWYLFTTFHNEGATLPAEAGSSRRPHRRGTLIAVADRLDGPFTLANDGEPVVSRDLMTLDGTLHVDRQGRPWFVYAHEWMQTTVGTIEALPLDTALQAAGEPRLLFRANEAAWARGQKQAAGDTVWVTDGPQFWRTPGGALMMLWSSYGDRGYVQALARSASGEVTGPWEQLGPLVTRDSGHGMLFRTFDGRLMMVLHRPFTRALGKLYEMREDADIVAVEREAVELDLEAYPTHPCTAPLSPTGAVLPDC